MKYGEFRRDRKHRQDVECRRVPDYFFELASVEMKTGKKTDVLSILDSAEPLGFWKISGRDVKKIFETMTPKMEQKISATLLKHKNPINPIAFDIYRRTLDLYELV